VRSKGSLEQRTTDKYMRTHKLQSWEVSLVELKRWSTCSGKNQSLKFSLKKRTCQSISRSGRKIEAQKDVAQHRTSVWVMEMQNVGLVVLCGTISAHTSTESGR
jgi:hypothetical protein